TPASTDTNAPTRRLNPIPELDVIHPPHPRWLENLGAETHLFRDWWGVRTNMIALGIKPSVVFVSDILGNPFGGESQGVTAFNNLGVDLFFDLERLAGLHGGTVLVSGSWRSGDCLSCEYIHNTFNVAQVCCGATYRMVDVFYEQTFAQDRLDIRLGRIAAGDEFLSSPLFGTFVQNGIDGNPVGIFFNSPGMSAYPRGTWGLRLRTRPTSLTGGFYAMTGVFNGDETLGENDKHGVDWSMKGPVFAIAEAGYRLNEFTYSKGLPGNYRVGGWYDDHRFSQFVPAALGQPNAATRGNAGFYLLMDQMVYREGKDPHSAQGLTPFVSILISPDEAVSTMPFFANGGLQYQGLIPGRKDDIAAFGVVYGAFSDRLQESQALTGMGVQNHETVLEWTYRIKFKPWFYIQPDFQYILRPGGTGQLPDALVLGAQLALSF
ncbi:MAG TPA: carbohydrate porin, partial [Candidatus Sulfotelmatobacter sp.]|nr:carbohydrate porin [Candidatus Sulfotelmatobacter sp.]